MKGQVLWVCIFLAFVQVSEQGKCFGDNHHQANFHPCDNRNFDLDVCVSQEWSCDPDRFCQLRINDHGVHMDCRDFGNYELCLEQQNASCDPHLQATAGQVECTYCFRDKQAVLDLISPPEATTSPRPTGPAPAPNSCYTSSCNHGDDLATCASGQWACDMDQFCEVHTSPATGDVTMACRPDTFQDLLHCQQLLVQHHCYPLGNSYAHDCHYCCTGSACVTDIMTIQATSQTDTMSPPTPPKATCTICQDLHCLVNAPQHQCLEGQTFCITSVKDSSQGRHITRGCADKLTCDDLHLQQTSQIAECADVDSHLLHQDSVCHFCCRGDNCNRPPQVVPSNDTLYTAGMAGPSQLVGR